jgi:signal transduction histidine kinase
VRSDVPDELLMQGYEGEVRQVLANVIGNSYDAVRGESGEIRIRAKEIRKGNGHKGIQFTVADNGAGIKPEYLHRIFEPFYTTKADVGTGLGLWVTKTIVEKRGGKIRVRSRSNGSHPYTMISFLMPADPATASVHSNS